MIISLDKKRIDNIQMKRQQEGNRWIKNFGHALRKISNEDLMSINQYYFSQKACQSLQMKRVSDTRIVFLLDYFICVVDNPCFKGIPIRND